MKIKQLTIITKMRNKNGKQKQKPVESARTGREKNCVNGTTGNFWFKGRSFTVCGLVSPPMEAVGF
jgi:hypothetical protein